MSDEDKVETGSENQQAVCTSEDPGPDTYKPAMPLMRAASILSALNAEEALELLGVAEKDLDQKGEDSEVKTCGCQECPKCAINRMLIADQVEREHSRLCDHFIQEYQHHIREGSAVDNAIRMMSARQKSPGDKLVGESIPLLDHGYVTLVDYLGSDQGIERAARLSYRGHEADRTPEQTRGLIRYLLNNRHTSPFEQCILTFQCKMPIFVARQWVRHRTARLNEMSGRYSELPHEFYTPAAEQVQKQSSSNKQGRDGAMSAEEIEGFLAACKANGLTFKSYGEDIETGIAKELARINLPLSTYTEWVWQIDLHNLMHFLGLRLDPHAQYEIRVYAEAMYKFAHGLFPIAMEAFDDYIKNAERFSKLEMDALRALIPNNAIGQTIPMGGMTDRELKAFWAKLGIETP